MSMGAGQSRLLPPAYKNLTRAVVLDSGLLEPLDSSTRSQHKSITPCKKTFRRSLRPRC